MVRVRNSIKSNSLIMRQEIVQNHFVPHVSRIDTFSIPESSGADGEMMNIVTCRTQPFQISGIAIGRIFIFVVHFYNFRNSVITTMFALTRAIRREPFPLSRSASHALSGIKLAARTMRTVIATGLASMRIWFPCDSKWFFAAGANPGVFKDGMLAPMLALLPRLKVALFAAVDTLVALTSGFPAQKCFPASLAVSFYWRNFINMVMQEPPRSPSPVVVMRPNDQWLATPAGTNSYDTVRLPANGFQKTRLGAVLWDALDSGVVFFIEIMATVFALEHSFWTALNGGRLYYGQRISETRRQMLHGLCLISAFLRAVLANIPRLALLKLAVTYLTFGGYVAINALFSWLAVCRLSFPTRRSVLWNIASLVHGRLAFPFRSLSTVSPSLPYYKPDAMFGARA